MTKFVIEKIANMVFISTEHDIVWEAWDESEFTERKLKNAMNRISKGHCGNVEFVRTF